MRKLLILLAFSLVCAAQILLPIVGGGSPPGGTFTLRYDPPASNMSCPGAGTCTVSLTDKAIVSGDLVIYQCDMWGGAAIASVSNGGTFVLGATAYDDNTQATISQGYILSAASEETSATVTPTANNAGIKACVIWEYSTTGSAPQLDGMNAIAFPASAASTTFQHPLYTPSSGTNNELSVVAAAPLYGGAVSSISAPFTKLSLASDGWAHVDSGTATTNPTWTWSASQGPVALGEMHFGFNVTAPKLWSFTDFAGTNNAVVDVGTINTKGLRLGMWRQAGTCQFHYSTAGSLPLSGSTGRLADGGSYTDSSTTGLDFSGDNTANCSLQLGKVSGAFATSDMKASINVSWDLDDSTIIGGIDSFGIYGYNEYVNAMISWDDGVAPYVQMENLGNGETHGRIDTPLSGVPYHIEVTFSTSLARSHTIKVYSGWQSPSSPGSLVGTITGTTVAGALPSFVWVGNTSNTTVPADKHIWFDTMLASMSAADPL